MRSNMLLMIGFGVSVLGLVSCAPDHQNQEPTNQVVDSWSLSEPVIKSKKKPGETYALRHTTLRELPGDAVLNFKADETRDVIYSIESACQTPGEFIEENTTLSQMNSIPLSSLIPERMWLELPAEKIEQSHCSFRFLVQTRSGSTHRFDVENVRFSGIDSASIESKAGVASKARIETGSMAVKDFSSQILPIGLETQTPKTLGLVCENFSNRRHYGAGGNESTLLHEVTNGEIQPEKIQGTDPRLKQTVQDCRAIKAFRDRRTGLKTYSIGSPLTVTFPLVGASIKVIEKLGTPEQGEQTVFRFEMKNKTKQTLLYRFPMRVSRIFMQALSTNRNWKGYVDSYTPTLISDAIVLAKVSATKVKKESNFYVFSMAPGSTAVVKIYFEADSRLCPWAHQMQTYKEMRKGFGGVLYG
ncbi:MAG TPA: hypothetical protein VM432_05935, partial [Bdellovibrionales bacterium]|nr:hypothetical protein [Bdellovibrionales bacterium]